MIINLRPKDVQINKDLEELGPWKYKAIGNDPILIIKNLPDGLIQSISIKIKAERGEVIEFYWNYQKEEPFKPSLRSFQTLERGVEKTYKFLIHSEKEIKKLRLDPSNAPGNIEIKGMKIVYVPHLKDIQQEHKINRLIPDKLNPLNEKRELIQAYHELLSQNKALQRKFVTMPSYDNIGKLALKGNAGYLFLINDSNNELRQHFDYSYSSKFNSKQFLETLSLKKEYCNDKEIKYFFFVIPDKSVVCKEFLPFEVKLIKRNSDLFQNLVPDFVRNLDKNCYFKNNSHINYLGGKELSYAYLNYVNPDFGRDEFEELLEEQISVEDSLHNGDLTWPKNWSYSEEEKESYLNEEVKTFKNTFLIDLRENIPEEFKAVGRRKTEHYKNPQSSTDLRVLIFRDSSLDFLKDVLSTCFNEMLLYWDHWFFNKDLIEWYKPDIILEIRTERFLENMKYEFLE
ncbi:hypothetical protein DSECCO2_616360 [anaerobic digester metagenome]